MQNLQNEYNNQLKNDIKLEKKEKEKYGSGFLFDDREQQKQRSLK